MSGWDVGVWIAAVILIAGPIIVFYFYLQEIFRRIREDDFGGN